MERVRRLNEPRRWCDKHRMAYRGRCSKCKPSVIEPGVVPFAGVHWIRADDGSERLVHVITAEIGVMEPSDVIFSFDESTLRHRVTVAQWTERALRHVGVPVQIRFGVADA